MHLARHAAGGDRALRRPKRYLAVDSPLTSLTWWRVMLDEAQNVGSGFSQVHTCPRRTPVHMNDLKKHTDNSNQISQLFASHPPRGAVQIPVLTRRGDKVGAGFCRY